MTAFRRLEMQLVAALRKHLATGRPAIVPEAGAMLWGMFCDLSASRTMGFSAPNPISPVEIEAWARLNRWPLQPHHVAILQAMDRAWLGKAEGEKPSAPISVNAFDAVFG